MHPDILIRNSPFRIRKTCFKPGEKWSWEGLDGDKVWNAKLSAPAARAKEPKNNKGPEGPLLYDTHREGRIIFLRVSH